MPNPLQPGANYAPTVNPPGDYNLVNNPVPNNRDSYTNVPNRSHPGYMPRGYTPGADTQFQGSQPANTNEIPGGPLPSRDRKNAPVDPMERYNQGSGNWDESDPYGWGPIGPPPSPPVWNSSYIGRGNQWENEMMQYQAAYDIWNMKYTNWYNSPAQQRLRGELAGYNPNMFASGAAVTSTQGGGGAVQGGQMQNLLGVVEKVAGLANIASTTKLNLASAANQKAQAKGNLETAGIAALEHAKKRWEADLSTSHIKMIDGVAYNQWERSQLAKYNKEFQESAQAEINRLMSGEMYKWMNANQINKFVAPFLLQMMGNMLKQ